MKCLDILKEAAAIGGYSITGTDAQSVSDKARALRRVNQIRADVASRFSGRWSALYREAWLSLVPVYSDGTVLVTINSRDVVGTGTTWTSAMVGRKFLGPNSEYYKIASVSSATALTLTEPYQGATTSGAVYQIWKDEYVLYPDVFSVIDFVNYNTPWQMREDTNKHSRSLSPRPTANESPSIYSLVGRKQYLGPYSTGTVSGTINTRILTGSATVWLGNIQPGYEITIGSYTYHVDTVDSDTQLTLKQCLVATIAASTSYSACGRNALCIRFSSPTSQMGVSYVYYSKSYPLVNDNDEDWIAEMYPHTILNGVAKFDYMDKNDPVRSGQAAQLYENDLRNAHEADASQYGGTYAIGLDIPDSARD